ncbi:hypothetical protein Tco_0600244 [Tanacetum coccineum]|uniref:Uncharacterized protein n=1 Tax=Tanacetum coccineum TaxID=301880 RepID=A0ABQ4WBD2_9ASTR
MKFGRVSGKVLQLEGYHIKGSVEDGPVSAMEGQSQEEVDAGRYQTSSIMLLYPNWFWIDVKEVDTSIKVLFFDYLRYVKTNGRHNYSDRNVRDKERSSCEGMLNNEFASIQILDSQIRCFTSISKDQKQNALQSHENLDCDNFCY